ncbi:tetratricopeptide repeat protein [Chryseolinea sp. T2]|uniref:tetratricopeptide repeat protein n=1 Tax=Chryseolinea sp. T2 TaxID=3129255 RepID=UPI0030781672
MKVAWTLTILLCSMYAGAQQKRSDTRKICEQARTAYESASYEEALALANKCLEEDPGNMETYITRGSTREQLKDLQGALTDYGIYNDRFPDQPDVLYSLATLRYTLGFYEQSKMDFIKLLGLQSAETNTVFFRIGASGSGSNQVTSKATGMEAIIFNYLGLVDTKLKHYPEAIKWLDSAIALQKKEPDYYVNRGIARQAMGDTTAIADFKQALVINPQHVAARANIANLQHSKGATQDSMDEIEKAIESDSSMLHPYLARAFQRMEGGYYKGALEDYDHAIEIEARDPDIWFNRGLVKEKLNDYKGAFTDYTQAIELNEKHDKAWLNRGNVLLKLGRYKEATEDYTVALTFHPDYAVAYYNRAVAFQRLKQPSLACTDLKKSEELGYKVGEKVKKEICK